MCIRDRLYDYGRGRELHLKEGAEAARLTPGEIKTAGKCPFFRVEEFCADGRAIVSDGLFSVATVLEGSGRIGTLCVRAGDSVFIPAAQKNTAVSGALRLLLTRPY